MMSEVENATEKENIEVNHGIHEETNQNEFETEQNQINTIKFNIKDLQNNHEFFQQNISNILEFIQHFDIETVDEPLQFIKFFITETIKNHPNEHETIFLLEYINIPSSFSLDDDISILKLFTQSPICQHINLINEYQKSCVDFDYTYTLDEKDEEIARLN